MRTLTQKQYVVRGGSPYPPRKAGTDLSGAVGAETHRATFRDEAPDA
ncbi:MAG: hypothetical protein R6X20_13965 [Phycisphaerae bacterium]